MNQFWGPPQEYPSANARAKVYIGSIPLSQSRYIDDRQLTEYRHAVALNSR